MTTFDVPSSSWQTPDGLRDPGSIAPALTDRALDRRLRVDGFVTFPLLDPDAVAQLRALYASLHPATGTGFEPDLSSTDRQYRREVDAALASALDPVVLPAFVDHEPYLRNFLCKWPGPDSGLYLHQDWAYVDERQGACTYVAWIALVDVLGHGGQLRVLRGSHRLDRSLRGTDLTAAWIGHEDVIEPCLESVPVPAGTCVVMNNALVHGSYPNHTDEPRLVAAIGVRPTTSPPAYFRAVRPGLAARYEVTERFLLEATPAELHAAPPDAPVAELIEVDPPRWDAEELARRLAGLGRGRGILRRLSERLGRR